MGFVAMQAVYLQNDTLITYLEGQFSKIIEYIAQAQREIPAPPDSNLEEIALRLLKVAFNISLVKKTPNERI